MIDTLLLIHLVLAFAVGSLWVTVITVIAEKKGSVLGGILGGLPSTSAFSFFFIGINQSSADAVQATTVFPLAFAVTSAYLFFYAYFAPKGFSRGIVLSLLMWFAISALIVASGLSDFAFALVGGIVISVITYFAFTKKLKLHNLKGEQKLYKPRNPAPRGWRGSFGCVFGTVEPNRRSCSGRHSGCVSSSFYFNPDNSEQKQGNRFLPCHNKALGVFWYPNDFSLCSVVQYTYPAFGVWLGTLISYPMVVPLAILSYRTVNSKRKLAS